MIHRRRNQTIYIYMHNSIHETLESLPENLELINTFSKLAREKINIEKSTVFLYTKDKHTEKEICSQLPKDKPTISGERPTMNNLIDEETVEDTRGWKDLLGS